MARKPLVETATQDEFGVFDDNDDTMFVDKPDMTYVPGFSDMRFERDRQIAEVVHGDRDPKTVRKMPVNCRWVRALSIDKQLPDGRKVIMAEMDGYRKVTNADVGKEWLTSLPPASKILADGSIATGDTILMVAGAEAAARNRGRKRKLTEAALASIGGGVDSEAEHAGTTAQIEKSVGHPVTVGGSKGKK
jgi:hypothetical protein